jgi:hypothetical protein
MRQLHGTRPQCGSRKNNTKAGLGSRKHHKALLHTKQSRGAQAHAVCPFTTAAGLHVWYHSLTTPGYSCMCMRHAVHSIPSQLAAPVRQKS